MRRLENRTHRKLLIVDGRIGFTGGVGIAEEWTGDAQDPDHWRDSHVRVRGPAVRGLQGAFAENWLEGTGVVLAGDRYLPELDEVEDGGAQPRARTPMQVMRSSATVGDTNAEALIYLALAAAKRSIELTSAYFVPRPAFTEALVEAAERGVDMRILVPGSHIDKEFVRTAGRASYDQLLDAGVRLFEYSSTMLHAKSLVVDGVWSCVGSVNFDTRSFQLHDEVALCVQSERFAGELREQFEKDLEVSEEIERGEWNARGPLLRARESVTKLARARAADALGAREQQHARDLAGVVPGRNVAAAVQRDRAPTRHGGSRARDQTIVFAPGERDRSADLLESGEHGRAHRLVGALEARRGDVGAHEPLGRRRRHQVGLCDRASQNQAPPALAAQQGGHDRHEGAAQTAHIGPGPRPQRPLPKARGAQTGHRQCPSGLGELERDPAAEGVAGDVDSPEAELVEKRGHRAGQHLRGRQRAVLKRRGRAEAR